jgi:hypothetical protein
LEKQINAKAQRGKGTTKALAGKLVAGKWGQKDGRSGWHRSA